MNRTSRRQYWIEEVRAFRASGMSRAAFCRERGYSMGSLKNWERHVAEGLTVPNNQRFAAVTTSSDMTFKRSSEVRVYVRLPLGVEIETGSMPSPEWLAETLLRLRDGVAP